MESKQADAALALAALESRALPNAPDGYTPKTVDCPSTRPSVRVAGSLSQNEKDFLSQRRQKTIPAMRDFLKRMNITGFDVDGYFSNHSGNTSSLPNIGIAISGGGYRALMTGAGAIRAFDSRESNSTNKGQLGGLLQSSTYLAGLSGGSWLVGSIYVNNFSTISSLLAPQGSQWEFQNSIFEGPDRGIQILTSADYYSTIYDEVQDKTKNFVTTITDYWGRALSFQLINATNGGPSYTWSSIRDQPGFSSGDSPYPIVVADSRRPFEMLISANTSIYEFTPFEFGTWDPTVYGFVPTEYLGSNFTNGSVPSGGNCVRGFDNAGYVMGTSSTLFNQFLLNINSTNAPDKFKTAIEQILKDVSSNQDDIAAYDPNPFFGYNPTGKSAIVNEQQLTLVDGGEDLQNIPLQPLIQPVRAVDAIFAVDSSADTNYNWPNGTALVATYQRSIDKSGIANGTAFPAIPDQNTFVNQGLNTRPTFFGCNASNATNSDGSPSPLVIYLPNSPYVYFGNVSTFDPDYKQAERDNIIENGYWMATRANGTADPEWPTCVGCAILSRSFDRTNTTVPQACQNCFQRYCWDGRVNSAQPPAYEPKVMNQTALATASSTGGRSPWAAAIAVSLAVVCVL